MAAGRFTDDEGRPIERPSVPTPRAREMGRTEMPRQRPRPGAPSRPQMSNWKLAFRVILVMVFIGAAWYAHFKTETFLIRDERFLMPESGAPIVEGVKHASMDKISRIFADDVGHSVYMLPLAKRRKSLVDNVDWIRDASVARLWPNQVLVRITERQPLAFLPVPSGRLTRFSLIDGDGVIMEQPKQARFTLPVLIGVSPDDLLSVRRERVRRLQQLTKELGSLGEKISEVHVDEPSNMKVTMPAGSRMVTLSLGDQNYAARMQNYLDHAAEIKKKVPNARIVDLRIEDRITVLE